MSGRQPDESLALLRGICNAIRRSHTAAENGITSRSGTAVGVLVGIAQELAWASSEIGKVMAFAAPVEDSPGDDSSGDNSPGNDKADGGNLDHGYFIGGPHASAMVYSLDHAEPVIAALCSVTEDDPDDYTVTDLAAPMIMGHDLL